MTSEIVTEPFEAAREAVAARIEEILDACSAKDFDRLAGFHLSGPKFTKFDDVEPLDRQDAETAMRAEIDGFAPLEQLVLAVDDLKIDVFGPVAVATGVFRAAFAIDGQEQSVRTRTTLVFVDDAGDWLIAHEHHSPFVASF